MRDIQIGSTELRIAEAEHWENNSGANVWDAALCCLKYLEVHPSLVAGKRVIELGTGPGAVGCAAAAVGAAAVTLTDLPAVVPLAALNIEANGLGATAVAVPLAWGAPLEQVQALPSYPFEVVLASDVLYLAETLPLFVQTLSHLFDARPDALCVLCNEHRERLPFPHQLFVGAGFSVRRVPLAEQHPEWSSEDIHLFLIRRQGSTRTCGSHESSGQPVDCSTQQSHLEAAAR